MQTAGLYLLGSEVKATPHMHNIDDEVQNRAVGIKLCFMTTASKLTIVSRPSLLYHPRIEMINFDRPLNISVRASISDCLVVQ